MLKYWVWFSAKGISPIKKDMLLNHYGTVEDIYYNDSFGNEIDEREKNELLDKSFESAERILELCETRDIKLVTMQDAGYPHRLKNIPGPPVLLYYKGKLPVFDEEAAIAIIGTRKPTPYGIAVTEKLAFHISQMGGYIVSGMAEGCDGAAHRGALKAGKPTTAVLGSGVDVIYPVFHRELYEDIIATGAVISEYPPGTEPMRSNFPQRNRIISGLALGVLVTEAGETSGTRITANHASEQGRDIYAVPGPIDNEAYIGTNELIRDGAAKLVMTAADVLAEYAFVYPHKITALDIPDLPYAPKPQTQKELKIAKAVEVIPVKKPDFAAIDAMPERRRLIMHAIAQSPRFIDDLVAVTGIATGVLLGELTMLCIEGALEELPGKRYCVSASMLK